MATYYLNADTGNDTTGDGSSALPWLTVSHAVSNSTSGDTIFAQSSTNDYVIEYIACNDQILVGENRENVRMTTNGAAIGAGLNNLASAENITFYNINLGGYYQCVLSSTPIVRNCTFHTITDSGGDVRSLFRGGTTYITGCVMYNLSTKVSLMYVDNGNSVHFYNNVYHKTSNWADTITGGGVTASLYFKNNIFYFNYSQSLKRGQVTLDEAVISNNCFVTTNTFTSGNIDSTNLINVDPLFVDEANRNYQLRPNSPCIDAGTIL